MGNCTLKAEQISCNKVVTDGKRSWLAVSTPFPLRGPERVAVADGNAGLFSMAAGGRVYVYDQHSIANPITHDLGEARSSRLGCRRPHRGYGATTEKVVPSGPGRPLPLPVVPVVSGWPSENRACSEEYR